MDENNIREIALKRALRIKGEVWPAKRYKVPEEMTGSLADWIAQKIPDAIESVGEPEIEEVEGPTLAEYLPEKLAKPAVPPKAATAYDKLLGLVGHDLVELFGPIGTLKSRFAHHVAIECQRLGKSVLYLDSEKSLSENRIAELEHYEFIPQLEKLIDRISNDKEHYDLLIVDSIGFPLLRSYFSLGVHERLTSLGKLILLRGYMKEFADRNRGLSFGTNQPVSDVWRIGKEEEELEATGVTEILPPTGGKSAFLAKAILYTKLVEATEKRTVVDLKVYKARELPKQVQVARVSLTSEGMGIEWRI